MAPIPTNVINFQKKRLIKHSQSSVPLRRFVIPFKRDKFVASNVCKGKIDVCTKRGVHFIGGEFAYSWYILRPVGNKTNSTVTCCLKYKRKKRKHSGCFKISFKFASAIFSAISSFVLFFSTNKSNLKFKKNIQVHSFKYFIAFSATNQTLLEFLKALIQCSDRSQCSTEILCGDRLLLIGLNTSGQEPNRIFSINFFKRNILPVTTKKKYH